MIHRLSVSSSGRRTVRPLGITMLLSLASIVGCERDSAPPEAAPPGNVQSLLVDLADDPDARDGTVTLLTGDRVTVRRIGGKRTVDVQAGPGRTHVAFRSEVVGDAIRVVPTDAMDLVASGKLDARLFDVTALLDFGYDDEHRDDLPLIVKGGLRMRAAVTRDLAVIGGFAMSVRKADAQQFWTEARAARTNGANETIWLDGLRRPLLDQSVPRIGAPVAWQAGHTGQGVTVGVIDSGIDAAHPDLSGAVLEAKNFSSDPSPLDHGGHGTHVASIVAGSGAGSGGKYKGVAPSAKLLDAKVCEGRSCSESAILAAMQWVVVEKKARVVNISLGGYDSPEIDPLEEAINRLTAEHGALFVVSAGNGGPRERTISSPASADAALAVGMVDRSDQLAAHSSRGPRIGDDGIKPEITAPGVDIVAARSQHAPIGEPGAMYVALSGTSMAAPHVTGAAAILASQHPDWSGAQIRGALTGSATPNPDLSVFQQGSGRVDVAKAIAQVLISEPGALSLGVQRWPHEDDEPVVRTVTYRNTGATAVTIDLRLQASGPDGRPAPDGMFALHPTSLSVPAHGAAQATLTADTRVSGSDGIYGGAVVARAGTLETRMLWSITREVESYDVTLQSIDRDGTAQPGGTVRVNGLDRPFYECVATEAVAGCIPFDASGKARLRLQKGRYTLEQFNVESGTSFTIDVIAQPELSVTGDVTVVLDARLAKPVALTVPDPTARRGRNFMDYVRPLANNVFYVVTVEVQPDSILRTVHLGPEVSKQDFMASLSGAWAVPNPSTGQLFDSPSIYRISYPFYGRVPTGFVHDVKPSELATVHARYDAPASGKIAMHACYHGDDSPSGMSHRVAFNACTLFSSLPFTRTEYSSTGALSWSTTMEQYSSDGERESTQTSNFMHYRAGRHYREHWNRAVFGPAFPEQTTRWLVRDGDRISAAIPLFSDADRTHAGVARVGSFRTTLFRDGQKVAEDTRSSLRANVAPGLATFRLEQEAVLGESTSPLSTKITAAWTFRSDTVRDGFQRLPASAVRFAPELDASGRAPAGIPFFVPVSVQRQADSAAARVKEITVEISYDDGVTWQNAPLVPKADGWLLIVRHPREASFVSLRAKSVDERGNSVEETILRAYALEATK